MTTHVQPEVNWGRWIARCPRDGCHNAEHFGLDEQTGHLGGLADEVFRCGHCNLTCVVRWPEEKYAIERILAARPVPSTRNWQPGETLDGLLRENSEHGLDYAAHLVT